MLRYAKTRKNTILDNIEKEVNFKGDYTEVVKSQLEEPVTHHELPVAQKNGNVGASSDAQTALITSLFSKL